jgi:hypothetical protein
MLPGSDGWGLFAFQLFFLDLSPPTIIQKDLVRAPLAG